MQRLIGSLVSFSMVAGVLVVIIYFGHKYGLHKVPDEFNLMIPTLPKGKVFWINRNRRDIAELERNDIIYFRKPNEERIPYHIARVIALPGDKVRIEKGKVYVNERAVPGIGGQAGRLDPLTEIIVPLNHIFILYDNRKYGRPKLAELLIHERLIRGTVIGK